MPRGKHKFCFPGLLLLSFCCFLLALGPYFCISVSALTFFFGFPLIFAWGQVLTLAEFSQSGASFWSWACFSLLAQALFFQDYFCLALTNDQCMPTIILKIYKDLQKQTREV